MNAERILVVNADDFGRSVGVNRGIIEAHEHGIVTSATMMVRWPAAEHAASYAMRNPALSVGLHLDLAEWEYRDDGWHALYEVVDSDDEAAVEQEVESQIARFVELLGRPPTHLDSHQHVHQQDPVRTALAQAGHRLGIPVRHVTPGITYNGGFYGQDGRGQPYPEAIGVEALCRLLRDLPPGVTELGCHPGFADDLDNVYRDERRREVEALCHPRVGATLDEHGIRLAPFAEVGGAAP